MQKGNEKILEILSERKKSLNELLDRALKLKHVDEIRFDEWDRTTRRILKRIFDDDVLTDYIEIAKYRMPLFVPTSIEEINKNQINKFVNKTLRILNLLNSLEVEIKLFDDKDFEKHTQKVNRSLRLRAGYLARPFIDAEVKAGMEEEKQKRR